MMERGMDNDVVIPSIYSAQRCLLYTNQHIIYSPGINSCLCFKLSESLSGRLVNVSVLHVVLEK